MSDDVKLCSEDVSVLGNDVPDDAVRACEDILVLGDVMPDNVAAACDNVAILKDADVVVACENCALLDDGVSENGIAFEVVHVLGDGVLEDDA